MIAWRAVEAASVPPGDDWLCGGERLVLAALHVPKRRAQWRCGRWAAKTAVTAVLGGAASGVEVRAGDDGVPHALRDGAELPVCISISHRNGIAVCAVASPARPIGCDLELVETRAPVFVSDWFTPAERKLVARARDDGERDLVVTAIWSAKESALKAAGSGLRRDPRSVEAADWTDAESDGWRSLRVRDVEGAVLEGWWRRHHDLVLSMVSVSPRGSAPVRIRGSAL